MPKSCGCEGLDFLSRGKMKPEKQQGGWGVGGGRERHGGPEDHGRSWIFLQMHWESVQGSHLQRAVMDLYLEKTALAAMGSLGPEGQESRMETVSGCWRKWWK